MKTTQIIITIGMIVIVILTVLIGVYIASNGGIKQGQGFMLAAIIIIAIIILCTADDITDKKSIIKATVEFIEKESASESDGHHAHYDILVALLKSTVNSPQNNPEAFIITMNRITEILKQKEHLWKETIETMNFNAVLALARLFSPEELINIKIGVNKISAQSIIASKICANYCEDLSTTEAFQILNWLKENGADIDSKVIASLPKEIRGSLTPTN